MQSDKLIYVIDDEKDICDLVCKALERFNYRTQSFRTGAAASKALRHQKPDVCIIDLGLPDMDGLTIVKELEHAPGTGVIILSGRNSLPDRVLGLEIGADDFISKPFDPRELVARINSVVRRMTKASQPTTETRNKVARFANWTFDASTLTLRSDAKGEADVLSSAEAELLMLLLKSPNRILSRDQLLSKRENTFDRCIDVRISCIRKKIEADPKSPRLIKTVYGAGYILTSDVSWG